MSDNPTGRFYSQKLGMPETGIVQDFHELVITHDFLMGTAHGILGPVSFSLRMSEVEKIKIQVDEQIK